jgi:cell division septation protein DedD
MERALGSTRAGLTDDDAETGCGISMSDNGYSRFRANDPYTRGGSASGPSGHDQDDPLSELARLIGQGQQGQGNPQEPPADWRAAPPPGNYDGYQYPGAPDPRYANAAPGYPVPDPYQGSDPYQAGPAGHDPRYDAQPPFHGQGYSDQGQGHGDPHFQGGGYDQAMYGHTAPQQQGYQGGQYFGDDDHGSHDDDFDDPPSSGGRGGFFTIIAVLCLAVVGTAGAFAYRSMFGGSGPNNPPVILADATPSKIVPAPLSADNAGRLGSDRPDLGQAERIVSREERPLNVQGTTGGIPRVISAGDGPVAPPSIPGNASSLAPVSSAPQSGPGEPRKVRTVIIKPDQQPIDPRVASNTAAFPNARTGGRSQPSAPAEPQGEAPLSLSPQSAPVETPPARPKLAPTARLAPAPAPAPAPATGSPTLPAAVAGGSFFVQVSAQKSEEDAQTTFRAMQAKFASQLSDRQPIIRRKDLGEKGIFYGVQVGPFASRDDAVALCESLKSAGGSCMIQKN